MQLTNLAVATVAATVAASPVVTEKRNLDIAVDDIKTLVNDILTDLEKILGGLGLTITQVFPSGSLPLPNEKREEVASALSAELQKKDLNVVLGGVEKLAADILKDLSKLLSDLGLSLVDVIAQNGIQGLI